jgi:hypothetical protein
VTLAQTTAVWFNGAPGSRQTSKANVNAAGKWYWGNGTLSVYAVGTPKGIEAGQRHTCIRCDAHDIILENLDLRHTGTGQLGSNLVLAGYSNRISVRDCDFSQCAYHNMSIWPRQAGAVYTVQRCTFTRSGLYGNPGNGQGIDVISPGSVNDILLTVEYCDFSHSGTVVYYDHAIYFKTGRLIFRYNFVHDNWIGSGFKVSGTKVMSGCECYCNLMINTHTCVLTTHGGNHKIYNNTFKHFLQGIWQDDISGRAHPQGLIVKNNILDADNVTGSCVYHGDNVTGWVSDYNCVYNEPPGAFQWGAGTAYNWAQWLAKSGQDSQSIHVDPKFKDPHRDDYTLQPTSPCIHAGTEVGLTKDFYGNAVPAGRAPDIGAAQYVSATVSIP